MFVQPSSKTPTTNLLQLTVGTGRPASAVSRGDLPSPCQAYGPIQSVTDLYRVQCSVEDEVYEGLGSYIGRLQPRASRYSSSCSDQITRGTPHDLMRNVRSDSSCDTTVTIGEWMDHHERVMSIGCLKAWMCRAKFRHSYLFKQPLHFRRYFIRRSIGVPASVLLSDMIRLGFYTALSATPVVETPQARAPTLDRSAGPQ